MKRIQIAMASAIVLAIGSAFVSRTPVNRPSNAAFEQVGSSCNSTTTACSTTGANICTDGTYQTRLSASTCSNPFLKRP